MSEAQNRLRDISGTPDEFATACQRACDGWMITQAECDAAIRKYQHEWNLAAMDQRNKP